MAANDSPEMRASFLKAMRNVANSVTVVTTMGPGGRQGATVSSFCSVSADPPTVLVCLNANSRIYEAVSSNKTFCVNVLPQGFADIAQRFAGVHDQEIEDRFSEIKTDQSTVAPDVIIKATSFTCLTEQEVLSGSHVIFIGHVTSINNGTEEPLIYLNGKYKKVTD